MKKFLSLFLTAMMLFGLVSITYADEPVKVGICIYQFNDNGNIGSREISHSNEMCR